MTVLQTFEAAEKEADLETVLSVVRDDYGIRRIASVVFGEGSVLISGFNDSGRAAELEIYGLDDLEPEAVQGAER